MPERIVATSVGLSAQLFLIFYLPSNPGAQLPDVLARINLYLYLETNSYNATLLTMRHHPMLQDNEYY